jgi:HTH-type transcriptional regulator/antitoxin HigA
LNPKTNTPTGSNLRGHVKGLRQKDLEKFFPGKSRVSEILNHKRALSIGMIRALHRGLGIPAEVLIREVAA